MSRAFDLDRYRSLHPKGIIDWAKRVLDPARRLIIHVLPRDAKPAPSPRDQRPDPAPARTYTPPTPEQLTLGGGVPVELWEPEFVTNGARRRSSVAMGV